jgi:hypothetical protein
MRFSSELLLYKRYIFLSIQIDLLFYPNIIFSSSCFLFYNNQVKNRIVTCFRFIQKWKFIWCLYFTTYTCALFAYLYFGKNVLCVRTNIVIFRVKFESKGDYFTSIFEKKKQYYWFIQIDTLIWNQLFLEK